MLMWSANVIAQEVISYN